MQLGIINKLEISENYSSDIIFNSKRISVLKIKDSFYGFGFFISNERQIYQKEAVNLIYTKLKEFRLVLGKITFSINYRY